MELQNNGTWYQGYYSGIFFKYQITVEGEIVNEQIIRKRNGNLGAT